MAQRFKYVLSRKIQNDLISKHNGYKGGDLDVPIIPNTVTQQATEQPAPLTSLPENITDWMNMTNDEFHRLTPSDIDKLSNASFELAFGRTRRLGNLLWQRVYQNNPNFQLIGTAIDNRDKTIPKNKVSGGDLVPPTPPTTPPATPTTPPAIPASTLPETAQDWKNMSTADLQKLTVDDIMTGLSEASFIILNTYNDPLSMALRNKLLIGNPNRDALVKALSDRYALDAWWVPEFDPLWKTDLIGVPKFWFQHSNHYSWSHSQGMMYNTYEDFQDTSFYKKFGSRVVTIKPPKKFARYMNSEIPGQERKSMGGASSQEYLDNIFEKYGQKWRVMFFQGDMTGHLSTGNDYYVYYIDCTDLQDYVDMLQTFYEDRDTLQPNEVIIMLAVQYRAAVRQHERDLIAQGFSQGVASEKAAEEAEKEASEDNSSSIWGEIGSVALDVLPLLL